MSTRLKKKTALLTVVIVCALALAGVAVARMQNSLAYDSYRREIKTCKKELPSLLESAATEKSDSTETFDAIYESKAKSIAYMAQNDAGYEASDAKMAEYRKLLEVDNVMIVERAGGVIARAQDTKADFSRARFNRLRTCFDASGLTEPVEVDLPGKDWQMRYYAAAIDNDTMVVIEQSPTELGELIETSGSVASALKNLSVGQNGYVMAVSAKDYLVTYSPYKKQIGSDAISLGIDASDLEDGTFFNATVGGRELYCGVSKIDGAYYIFAIPESDTAAARNTTVSVILFIFFVVAASVALYGIFVMHDDERTGTDLERFVNLGPVSFNRTIAKKAAALSLAGLVAIVGISFCMQTLFALSSQSLANSARAESVSATIKRNASRRAELEREYDERYLSKCRVAAYIVSEKPELATKEKLQDLADILEIAEVYVLDGNGDMIASSSPVKSYSLSTDPSESSYEFRELLGGKDELVQEMSTNDSTGEVEQFIGVATHDARGYADGIVQIAVRPKRLENLIKSVKIDRVLSGVKVGANGFAFAVEKSSGKVAYFPAETVQGKTATDAGLAVDQLRDGFSDYITVGGETYFANCVETDDYYIYVAGPEGELMAERGPLTLTTAGVALACLAVIFAVLSFDTERDAAAARTAEETTHPDAAASGRNIDVTLSDGRVKRSDSAISRWLDSSLSWAEKTPEQKLGCVLRWLTGLGAFLIFAAVMLKDQVFGSGSVFAYVLEGGWTRGLNIFAVTAAVMYACVAVTVASVIRWLLRLLSDALGARGETICRLLSSTVKYGMLLCMLYWCLGVLGVDTATLLAGAGIITLAVSFGAKDLVTDLLCGLFIIFDGEFRVGDIIQVGASTGTVMEIGMRTTKVNDGNGNVMLLRNSAVSNVVNKTKLNSYASVDIKLPIGESLPYVENTLKTELPRVHTRVDAIIDGPFYKGVVELSDSSMTIRVVATCKETDRSQVTRSLQREMKLLLSRYDVAPYQLVYDHESVDDSKKPTYSEQRSADQYSKEQEEAARELGNESTSENEG